MKRANIVDSSGWLEYFGGTKRAKLFKAAIEDEKKLVVPVICIYEVFKKVLREFDEDKALQVASVMMSGSVIDIDTSLVLEAAHLKLPLANSIIYATALRYNATLWTQDDHFVDLPNVRFFAR